MHSAVLKTGGWMSDERLLLLGCGILKKEVGLLIKRNGWLLDTLFVDSILHVDFDALATTLQAAMARHAGRRTVVFYGACHPLMDRMLEDAGTLRTAGQNCVEMLLGHERFTAELAGGAYFLLEDWARRWDQMITRTFGNNDAVTKQIFQGDRSSLLCLRTPCSGDFSIEAEQASQRVGLPLRWLDVSLEHLETILREAMDQRLRRT